MAKINFIYRGKEDSGKLSIRLVHGKDIDYRIATPIESKKEYWFKRTTKNGKTTQKHLQLKDLPNNGTHELKDHKTVFQNITKKNNLELNADLHKCYNSKNAVELEKNKKYYKTNTQFLIIFEKHIKCLQAYII